MNPQLPNKPGTVVNPIDEILWFDIRQAVEMVIQQPTEVISVERGDTLATIEAGTKYITITLSDITPKQPALIVPPAD